MPYLSELIGSVVVDQEGKKIGRADDIIASRAKKFPVIVGLVLKKRKFIKSQRTNFPWKYVRSFERGKIVVELREGQYFPCESDILLRRDILDRQIVDMDGYRIVRVSDVSIARVGNDLKVVGACVGFPSILRRLGFMRLAERIRSNQKGFQREGIIPWHLISTVEPIPGDVKLEISYAQFRRTHPSDIADIIEQLDPEGICTEYWAGKEDRERAVAGLPSTLPTSSQGHSHKSKRSNGPRPHHTGGANGRRRMKDKSNKAREDNDYEDDNEEEDGETRYVSNRWSAVNRAERYKRRLEDNGEEEAALKIDEDNPLPDVIDPITLEPVIRPAISPFGHVMGAATWKAVLAESGMCPFTKKPLSWEQCRILTVHNIEAYRDKIIR